MFGGADYLMWNGDGKFDVNLTMSHPMELDPKGLRAVRSMAPLLGYGAIQYRMFGAVLRPEESKIRPPKYCWVFVPGTDAPSKVAPSWFIADELKQALITVEASKGTLYLEGWGLLRYTHQGIELIPDAGPLAEDHPHSGWVAVLIPQRPSAIVSQALVRSARWRLSLMTSWIAGGLWLGLLVGLRFGLMGDGVEPTFNAGWAKNAWPQTAGVEDWFELRSSYVPEILNAPSALSMKGRGFTGNHSPLEMGEDLNAENNLPLFWVVLGLYSSNDGAKHWQDLYQKEGQEAVIFERQIPGKGLLHAVALPYRGFDPVPFLKHIRKHVLTDAWLLPGKESAGSSPGISSEGSPS